MSDVSESLQVRLATPDLCIQRLRNLGFNGFVFPGRRGWQTVVPYGGPGSLALSDKQLSDFSRRLMAPIVNYYVNDFCWGFELALPDGRVTAFLRWDGDPAEWGLPPEQSAVPILDETILAAVVPLSRVRKFLAPTPLEKVLEWELFAEAMGFPQFKQLNPAYSTAHPADMRSMGGIEVGHPPQFMKREGVP